MDGGKYQQSFQMEREREREREREKKAETGLSKGLTGSNALTMFLKQVNYSKETLT
jgi:hypothetical protein